MSEPIMIIPAGQPLERVALDAISIHLRDGYIFQPVFQPYAMDEAGNVTEARLIAVQLVKPLAPPVIKVPRGKVKAA